jgi:lipoprotein NlpI
MENWRIYSKIPIFFMKKNSGGALFGRIFDLLWNISYFLVDLVWNYPSVINFVLAQVSSCAHSDSVALQKDNKAYIENQSTRGVTLKVLKLLQWLEFLKYSSEEFFRTQFLFELPIFFDSVTFTFLRNDLLRCTNVGNSRSSFLNQNLK